MGMNRYAGVNWSTTTSLIQQEGFCANLQFYVGSCHGSRTTFNITHEFCPSTASC